MKKLLVIILIVGGAYAQTNLLQNSSFETWTGGLPEHWNKQSGLTVNQSTDPRTGNYAVNLVRTQSTHKRFEQPNISVTPGSEYTFRVYAKGDGDIRFGIQDGSGSSDYHYGPYTTLNNVTNYSEITWTYTPSNATVKFIISVRNTSSDGITIDDAFFGTSGGNQPPSISNIQQSPQNPTSSDNVTVTADISDPDGDNIAKDSLYYRVWQAGSWGDWTQVYHSSTSPYTYTIPSQSNHDSVEYYIIAEDDQGNRSESGHYKYRVSDDPVIENVQQSPALPTSSDIVTVTADITDPNNDLSTDSLFYSTDGGNTYTQVYHTDVTGNTYTYQIPAQSDGTTVQYYIMAKDNQGNRSTTSTYSYTVSDLLPPVINEIMYNPSPDDNIFEYVEIYNPNDQSYDVSNWVLTGTITNDFTIPDGVQIPPYGYLVISKDTQQLRAQYGQAGLGFIGDGNDTLVGDATFQLGNGGDQVILKDNNLNIIDEVDYDDSSPWPTAPDGGGPSLGLKNPELDNSQGGNWCSEEGLDATYGGTPGAPNECGNVTRNGGFESWSGGVPEAWNLETNVTVFEETNVKHRGSRSAKISVTGDGEGIYQNFEQVVGGKKYHFTTWLYASGEVSGHPSIGVELRFYNGDWNYIESHGPFYPNGTGAWKRISRRGDIPGSATKMRIYIIGYSTTKGDAGYADDVNFISEGAVATGISEETPITHDLSITQNAHRITFVVTENGPTVVDIFDIGGRKVKELTVRGEVTLSTRSFKPGVYFAVVRGRTFRTGKFVIVR